MAALGWTVFVTYGSLVPLDFQPVPFDLALERLLNLPSPSMAVGTRADLVANLLLFIPLTFLWMGAFACDASLRRQLAVAVLLAPLAIMATVGLEFTQISFPPRTTSQNDIIAESIGGILGILLWFLTGQALADWVRSYNRQPASRIEWLLAAYVLGFIVFSLMPFDLSISVSELYGKFEQGQIVLIPFTYDYGSVGGLVYQHFADIVLFVPVGAWIAAGRVMASFGRPVLAAALAGALFAAIVEFAQLLVLSRYTDTTDILFGTLGCALGGWIMSRRMERRADSSVASLNHSTARTAIAIIGYSVFLLIGFWFPFDVSLDPTFVRQRLESVHFIPFTAMYWGTEFTAITQVLLRVLLFAPLGALWARAGVSVRSVAIRRLILVTGVAYSASVALAIEAGQILMPSRVADPTEVFLCTVGALGGVLLTSSVFAPRVVADQSFPRRQNERGPRRQHN